MKQNKPSNNYRFVILSNQPFDLELKTNKWHIATKLAKRGYDVVFVDPPLRFKALKNFLKKPSLNLGELFFHTEKKAPNLYVYKPANLFNFKPFSSLNTYLHSKKINQIIQNLHNNEEKSIKNKTSTHTNKKIDSNSKTIMWIYHFDFPDLENFLTKINYDLMIYDVVDEYTAFPEYANSKTINKGLVSFLQKIDDYLKIHLNQKGKSGVEWVLHREKWLSDNADLLFASAPGLVEKFKNWRKQVEYLPNGADVEMFDKPKSSFEEPKDLKPIPHPRIGFAGAIDTYKNNIKLIEKTASTLKDFNFVMIGPEKVSDPDLDLKKLKSFSNVHFLGLKKWEQTPNYFNHFDVFFIPYNLNDYTVKGCFPVKYFEALAAGLPTVVTDMPAYKGYDVDGYVSKDDDEFISNIKMAYDENSPKKIKNRKELAKQNTWDGKLDKQIRLIDEFIKK